MRYAWEVGMRVALLRGVSVIGFNTIDEVYRRLGVITRVRLTNNRKFDAMGCHIRTGTLGYDALRIEPATQEHGRLFMEARIREALINGILTTNWGILSTDTLEKLNSLIVEDVETSSAASKAAPGEKNGEDIVDTTD